MRPTNLQLKPPDESTSQLYYPLVTHIGQRLQFSTPKFYRSTFSKAKRFPLLGVNALIGPGSYRACIGFNTKTSMARYVTCLFI